MIGLRITRPRTGIEYKLPYNPSNFFAHTRLFITCHPTEHAPAETGEYPSDIPQFAGHEKKIEE